MSSDTDSVYSSDTLVEDDDGSSTDVSISSSEAEEESRLHTLEYPLLNARARTHLRPTSTFDPISHRFQFRPSPDSEPHLHLFDVIARITSRECYLTTAGDVQTREEGEPPVASCWLEAPGAGRSDFKFLEVLCEVREAALRASEEVETSQLLLTPPGHRSVLLQVGWRLRDEDGGPRGGELPIFDREDRQVPPTSDPPIGRLVRVFFYLFRGIPVPRAKTMVVANLSCMILL